MGGLPLGHEGHPQVVEVFGSEPGTSPRLAVRINRILVLALEKTRFPQQPPAPEIFGVVPKDLPEQPLGLGILSFAMVLPREDHAFVRHGIRSRWTEEFSFARRRAAREGPGREST